MSPKIPSPTPITGIQNPGGEPIQRLPVDVFQKDHPFAFALYIQALLAWQKDGNQNVDKDNVTGTSYFQVTGVHGVPYVPWQEDPTPGTVPNIGYCTHRSTLFMPWHRPYLMLYEQIIFAYAEEIAKNATGYAAEAYKEALPQVRLPYWDWAKKPNLPNIVMSPDITLTVPGKSAEDKATLHLEHNPLYSYKFTSPYAVELLQEEMNWEKSPAWAETKRCPDADGKSNQEIANVQVGTFRAFKLQTWQALTAIKDFDQFTCQAWRPDESPHTYTSVEVMHNNIHNYTGTNDTVLDDDDTKRLGNMTDVQASSFDPVFWLHHVNCDRLTALWQALNPDCTIAEWPSLNDRFTAAAGTMEGGKSRLEPWHKTDQHDTGDYYIADDTKELTSTFSGGYYYPETPLEYITDPEAMKKYTTKAINDLYGPAKPRTPAPPPPKGGFQDVKPPVEGNPGAVTKHWQVFLRVKNFALTGTWAIHVFMGELPESTTDWFLSENRVGSVTMLSNRSRAQCANCISQAESDILVTGTVPLNEALEERGIDTDDVHAVVEYLKKELSWRAVKDTQNVPLTDDLGLTVGVSAQSVSIPDSPGKLPEWGHSHVYPEATAGKDYGLDNENRADLKSHVVKSTTTCASIQDHYEIAMAQIFQWNPDVGCNCNALLVDYNVCVGVIGQQTTRTKPPSGVTTPLPTQPKVISNCKKFHLVQSTVTFSSIQQYYKITMAQIAKWSPTVGSDCKGLWKDYWLLEDRLLSASTSTIQNKISESQDLQQPDNSHEPAAVAQAPVSEVQIPQSHTANANHVFSWALVQDLLSEASRDGHHIQPYDDATDVFFQSRPNNSHFSATSQPPSSWQLFDKKTISSHSSLDDTVAHLRGLIHLYFARVNIFFPLLLKWNIIEIFEIVVAKEGYGQEQTDVVEMAQYGLLLVVLCLALLSSSGQSDIRLDGKDASRQPSSSHHDNQLMRHLWDKVRLVLGYISTDMSLAAAQSSMLASIFMGACGLVAEAFHWAHATAVKCESMARSYAKIESIPDGFRRLYWISFIYECDFISEISVVSPSGIARYEDKIPYPAFSTETCSVSPSVPESSEYSTRSQEELVAFQITTNSAIRRFLNTVNSVVYDDKEQFRTRHASWLLRVSEDLWSHHSAIYRNLPEFLLTSASEDVSMTGADSNSPANLESPTARIRDLPTGNNSWNILRLKGRYFAGQYIIHRPFIEFIVLNIDNFETHPCKDAVLKKSQSCLDGCMGFIKVFDVEAVNSLTCLFPTGMV
ncbi:oleate-activated transcription factor 1 [Fusarium longipes]|uniref:Oleate-activated transcription factor 1 n=1 Tax=Fusarium longipes TaxID=694270 RepID=A0A395S2N4_9HYPO|nr:oleate-activated transcription factor 1 [Fusarium longipes]